jgi:sulfatase modifying factor 1
MEWEKAARGAGYEPGPGGEAGPAFVKRPRVYPWGDRFDAARANSADFWGAANAGLEIKKTRAKGLLPVGSFDGQGESPYGVADMAGNAQEWTSSWYRAYPGNTYRHKLFGTQVKVLRGGSYLDGGPGLRSTRRQIGGLPNLYDDPIGGFRCLKEPTVIDRMDEGK